MFKKLSQHLLLIIKNQSVIMTQNEQIAAGVAQLVTLATGIGSDVQAIIAASDQSATISAIATANSALTAAKAALDPLVPAPAEVPVSDTPPVAAP